MKPCKWLITKIVSEKYQDSVLGDFYETYYEIKQKYGLVKALHWYLVQFVTSLPVFFSNHILRGIAMIKNYIKIAFRNLVKQKVISYINILGLSIGLACSLLIYLYVEDELSFDKFHEKGDSIYRIAKMEYNKNNEIEFQSASLPAVMSEPFLEYFPEVETLTRWTGSSCVVASGEKMFPEEVRMADKSFFEIFSFPLISGDPAVVLSQDNMVVISQSYAEKYFGDEDPVGKTLIMTFGQIQREYIVSGISENCPSNSTLEFDIVISIQNLVWAWYPEALTSWGDFSIPFYLHLKPGVEPGQLENRFEAFIEHSFESEIERWRSRGFWEGKGHPFAFRLQNIKDVHLEHEVVGSSDPKYSMILAGIALIVLVIATINFMNLSVGRSSLRSKEIGIRKVMGAGRKQLVRQFWSESLIITFISMLIGLLIAWLVIPTFNDLSGKILTMGSFFQTRNIGALIFLILLVGIIAGSYPAILMARFRPVEILRGKLKFGGRNILTKSLVVLQFSLAVILVISTIVLSGQLNYLLSMDLGYDREGLIVARIQEIEDDESVKVVDQFRQRLQQSSNIINVSGTSVSFGRGLSSYPLDIDGKEIILHQFRIEYDYLKTIGVNVIQGRDFSRQFATDTLSVIVNKKFVEVMGKDDVLGKTIGEVTGVSSKFYPHKLRIIGVVDNYNVTTLTREINPVILMMEPGWRMSFMLVRISTENITETIDMLRNTWKEIKPDKPFDYRFHDEDIESQYNDEKRWSAIIQYSSIMAVLIACMGIFGLTSISINRRIKEIGLRKVLGADLKQIIKLVTGEFILLVILANLIAMPISLKVMDAVLSGYHYRISIGIQYFLFAGFLTVFVALITIVYLSVKAALTNPADSLRCE
ncbi:MAG: FtsX-like permease family protein [bacterium]|nr:FtsX-like permease family protein [bacterium]